MLYLLNVCTFELSKTTVLKFADDMVILSLLNKNESSHGPVVDHFMTVCRRFSIDYCVKNKDMLIDFPHSQVSPVRTLK